MEIDWIILVGAAAILVFPGPLLYPAVGRDRLASSHSARFRVERMLGTWQHWIDLIRAAGGAYILTKVAIRVDPEMLGEEYFHHDMILWGGILVAAVLAQTIQFRRGIFYFTAPVFFLWGISLVLVNWLPALFAIAFSAIFARMADHVELKLPLMAGLLVVTAYLVSGFSLNLVLAAVLIVLPMIVAFCSMQHLVCYSRDMAVE